MLINMVPLELFYQRGIKVLIKERWKDGEGKKYNKILQKVFKKGGTVNNSPFGLIHDHVDLQGILIPESSKIINVYFDKIDFSKAIIKNAWLENTKFQDCLFFKTNLEKISDHGNIYNNCLFHETSFKSGVIGYEGSKFTDCIFEKASFKGTGFIRAEFKNCYFRNCNLNLVDFDASSFDNCEFEGILKDTWFRGGYKFEDDLKRFGLPKKNEMKNVSFNRAKLEFVNFSNNCNLSSILLPENSDYLIISNWRDFLNYLSTKKNDLSENDKRELEIFIKVYSVHAKTQNENIVNYRDFIKEYGESVANYIWSEIQNY